VGVVLWFFKIITCSRYFWKKIKIKRIHYFSGYLNKNQSKELWIPAIFKKTIKIKEPSVLVFENAQRTGSFLGGYLSLSKFCKPRLYIRMGVFDFYNNHNYMRTRYLIFLRTTVITLRTTLIPRKSQKGLYLDQLPKQTMWFHFLLSAPAFFSFWCQLLFT
jgi:hypothetical protein